MACVVIGGIDPGVTGAWAIYDPFRETMRVFPAPVVRVRVGGTCRARPDVAATVALARRFAAAGVSEIYFENVNGMPGQSGQFAFGHAAGVAEAAAIAAGLSIVPIAPTAWKALAGLPRGLKRAAAKTASRERAAELFPSAADLFKRVKDDGSADAALIAYAGAKKLSRVG